MALLGSNSPWLAGLSNLTFPSGPMVPVSARLPSSSSLPVAFEPSGNSNSTGLPWPWPWPWPKVDLPAPAAANASASKGLPSSPSLTSVAVPSELPSLSIRSPAFWGSPGVLFLPLPLPGAVLATPPLPAKPWDRSISGTVNLSPICLAWPSLPPA